MLVELRLGLVDLFISLFIISRIFLFYDVGQHNGGRKQDNAKGKPTIIHRLLADLRMCGWRGSQPASAKLSDRIGERSLGHGAG